MTGPAAVRFFHAWDTYAKVVAANYMFHRELSEAVKSVLESRFDGRPFSVLDLGCGDAATFAPILEKFPLKSYRGVDLSPAALAVARSNLSVLDCPVELTQADILSELAASQSHDVIYTSFVLHHLTTKAKAEFFRLASEKLDSGGVLLLIDVFREEGEILAAYHAAYADLVRGGMTSLADSEKEAICEHLLDNDFPESVSVIQSQAEAAGLRMAETAAPHKYHRFLAFVKS
jgi:ubiquinone/menaquinone biosynthesis C-methylase UbiE